MSQQPNNVAFDQAAIDQALQDEAVLDEPITREAEEATEAPPRRQPRYNVILWDDDDHTFAYVILMLQKLFGYVPERGYKLAQEIDRQGRAIVLTTTMEHAELKRDQIHAFGKDFLTAACKGSMKATIEPVPGE